MRGYRLAKNAVKFTAGCAAVATGRFRGSLRGHQACIFDYHRVTEDDGFCSGLDNWNVTPKTFERHARWLAHHAECVTLDYLWETLERPCPKPVVAITFDDGYANFRHHVLPVIQAYHLPATVSVVTQYLGSPDPFPFDTWGCRIAGRTEPWAWRPMSWTELEECVASGLVVVGSHSHSHFCATDCSETQLTEEVMISRDLIRSRLGPEHGRVYAYPYGSSHLGQVTPGYVEAVRCAGYELGLTTDLGLLGPQTDPLLLPRIEAHGWDSPAILRAKAEGHLGPIRALQGFRKPRRFFATPGAYAEVAL